MILEKKVGYKQTKLGLIPEDWSVCTFADIADKKVKWSITGGPFGSNLKAEHYREEGVRIIQLQNIGDGEFRDISKIYTSINKADELIACNIFPSEIILSKMGDPVARACNIPNTEKRWVMGSDGIRLVVDESQYDKRFVLDYINYSIFRNLAISRSTGSTRRRIGLVDLKKIPFIKPPLPEQQKIATILNTWDKAIATQEKLITEKQKLKKGLMQQLLTGKKRFAGFINEWEEKSFKDITKINQGLQIPISKRHIENIPNSFFYITNEFLKKNSNYKYYILNPSESVKCSEDDILMTRTGNTGMVVTGVKGVFHNNFFKIAYQKNRINKDFLFYILNSDRIQHTIKKLAGTSTIPDLNHSEFYGITIKLPNLKEQQKISDTLKNCDLELSSLKLKKEELCRLKLGLMQQLLTGEKRVKI